MPQIFQVLKCYKCLTFQVHPTKKSMHWECKLCGIKQSMKRHYGVGTAKDCRMQVQKLNIARGEIDENKEIDSPGSDTDNEDLNVNQTHNTITVKSKWSQFVEEVSENDDIASETLHMGNNQVVLEMPKKRSKKFHVDFSKKQQKVDTNAQSKQTDTDIEFLEILLSNNSNNKQLKSYNCCKSTSMKNCNKNLKKNYLDNVNKIKENSKWTEFVDTTNDNEINSTLHDPNIAESSQLIGSNNDTKMFENNTVEGNLKGVQFTEKNPSFDTRKDSAGYQTPFSLCNDDDLDDILNI